MRLFFQWSRAVSYTHLDIAEDVYAYLEIYRKYNEDYGISDILSGNVKKLSLIHI